MSKSNYEIYAEEKQPELLKKTVTLEECIKKLQDNKKTFSKVYMEAQMELVASMFGLIYEEVERAVDGKEYWCV